MDTVERYARAFGIDPIWLLRGDTRSPLGNRIARNFTEAVPNGIRDIPGARPVQMLELAAAAGGGAYNLDETPVTNSVYFRRDWLDKHAIDPTQAVVISVHNDSMEPTLPAGCKILVDRHRRRRLSGHLFVLRTEDGMIVKRLAHDGGDDWLLVSDNDSPDWPTQPWPDGAEIIGEVKWMAREFP